MRKILEFTLDEATNVLDGPEGRLLLEPKPSALLAFFIANQGKDISRDELIKHVWQGHIVSDGAINRVVAQLRKALNDTDKIKRFIVTVPKVGYRFIVAAETPVKRKPPRQSKKKTPQVAVFALMSVAFAFMLTRQNSLPDEAALMPRVSPLVRLSSEQFGPAISPDGARIVFSVRTEDGADLMMADGLATPPVRIGETGGLATSAAWSPNGAGLAYQYRTRDTCRIIWLPFGEGLNAENLYDCHVAGQMSLAFSVDGATLYFSERATPYDPAEVFALDLNGASKRRLSQPTAFGRGNHFIDVHPQSGRLLLLSDRAAGQTSAYEVDDFEATFNQIIAWPYRLDQAAWGHEGTTIVHPDMHPSYQLLETDISTGEPRILATQSRRIKEPARAPDGKDYIYTSYLHNRDIWLNGSEASQLNSSVMDYAPSLSRDGERIAFISKRTGQSQVFFNHIDGGNQSVVALPIEGLSVFGLEWSTDDKHLLVASSQGLWVINTETKNVINHHRAPLPIYGATWLSDNDIGYSLREKGRWQRYSYSFNAPDKETAHNDDWVFQVGAGSNQYYVDQSGEVSLNGTTTLLIDCAPPLYGRHFTYQAYAGRFYCPSANYDQIISWGPAQGVQTVGNYDVSLGQFAVSQDRLTHTVLKATSSDIMRVNIDR